MNSEKDLLESKLHQHHPKQLISNYQLKKQQIDLQLHQSISMLITQKQNSFQQTIKSLQLISPLNTLERGYAIASDSKGNVIQESKKIREGDKISVRLHKGSVKAEVTEINN